MIYYAIRHKETQAFLSAAWQRGGTYWEGEADNLPPRLFATSIAAQKFVEMWAKGQARAASDWTESSPLGPRECLRVYTVYEDQGRSRSDLLIVPLSLSEV
ncbi:MAG: hypothetical protein WC455_15020 [Dehalococcoidia bacterium]|jgi:hypothetical protein